MITNEITEISTVTIPPDQRFDTCPPSLPQDPIFSNHRMSYPAIVVDHPSDPEKTLHRSDPTGRRQSISASPRDLRTASWSCICKDQLVMDVVHCHRVETHQIDHAGLGLACSVKRPHCLDQDLLRCCFVLAPYWVYQY